MAIDEGSGLGRRATLGLAAVLAATVMTGAVGIAALPHRSAAPPAPPAATPAKAHATPPAAPLVWHDDLQEVD
jgi:uncharacterized iron-regulated membrane protein